MDRVNSGTFWNWYETKFGVTCRSVSLMITQFASLQNSLHDLQFFTSLAHIKFYWNSHWWCKCYLFGITCTMWKQMCRAEGNGVSSRSGVDEAIKSRVKTAWNTETSAAQLWLLDVCKCNYETYLTHTRTHSLLNFLRSLFPCGIVMCVCVCVCECVCVCMRVIYLTQAVLV